MDDALKNKITATRDRLIKDLQEFLALDKKDKYVLGKKIDNYCVDLLKSIEGSQPDDDEFQQFMDLLYGGQQLDNFGEAWAPTEEKVKGWIKFLKTFTLRK
ncbi:MAG: hypothetical protein ABID38_00800 [Candidatus Diapherotrites archaeon]